MIYRTVGFRTRRSVFWTAGVLAVLMLNVTAVQYAVAAEPSLLRLALQVVWIVGVFLGTHRILKRLEDLEAGRQEPSEGMRLAFDSASVLPTTGYLPIIVF